MFFVYAVWGAVTTYTGGLGSRLHHNQFHRRWSWLGSLPPHAGWIGPALFIVGFGAWESLLPFGDDTTADIL